MLPPLTLDIRFTPIREQPDKWSIEVRANGRLLRKLPGAVIPMEGPWGLIFDLRQIGEDEE